MFGRHRPFPRPFAAVLIVAVALHGSLALAAESANKRDKKGLPLGSYSASCTCTFSGGAYLSCFCANLNAKWFQTSIDARTCPGPKDIKNCNGVLTCTSGTTAACPEEQNAAR